MHGVAITAYKDFPSLLNLVQLLDPNQYKISVHIDKKSGITSSEMEELRRHGCNVIKRYTITWGSYTHLQAVIDLVKGLSADPDVDYVHVISGQDYPVKSFEEIQEICNGSIYMTVTPQSRMPDHVRRRMENYNVFYFLHGAKSLYKALDAASLTAQDLFKIKRSRIGPHHHIYKGMIWVSLPSNVCRSIFNMPSTTRFLKSLRTAYLPEEFFFQTVILNSAFRGLVIETNLRFTDWSHRNGSKPAILDRSDYEKILESNAIFARKINSSISAELVQALQSGKMLL